MGKKRACRRSDKEIMMHERAVKLRKMTDEQLCDYIDSANALSEEKGYKKGFEACKKESKAGKVSEFLEKLQESKISGIGIVTVNKLLKVARENGYI